MPVADDAGKVGDADEAGGAGDRQGRVTRRASFGAPRSAQPAGSSGGSGSA
jgi:hypothetical protein